MARPRKQPEPPAQGFVVANDSFGGPIDGVPHSFYKGQIVEAGSKPHLLWPHLFDPLQVQWWRNEEPPVEQATAEPGEQRA